MSCDVLLPYSFKNSDAKHIPIIPFLFAISSICLSFKFLGWLQTEFTQELVGIDYVGLGSDFDGVEETKMPLDIRNVKHLKILEDKMKLEGFTSEEISKVMGENWLRVLNDFF